MSRVNQSHGDMGRGRQGDKGTRGQGEKHMSCCHPSILSHIPLSPCPLVPLSPCPLVFWTLCLRVSVAIPLILFAVACRQDMQDQPKYKPLAPSSFFSDGKSARQLVEGTAPYSPEGKAAPPITDLSKMTTPPFTLTPQVMDRGQGRFNIYCSPCHGRLGYGNGMVVQRGFRAPPSYHIDRLRQAPLGHFYDVMTNGFGAMSSYADKVAPDDRWAVAAYIRALQLSQHATINDAPPEVRAKLQSGGQKQ